MHLKLNEYRGILDRETKKIFLESFKHALNKVDKYKFGFVGIAGSIDKEESHDIDVIILPNKDVKIGEAIIELIKLYDKTEEYMKRHHKRYYLVPCPKFAMQEMVYHIAAGEEGFAGMIPLHSMFFTNYKDLKRLSPKSFLQKIKNELIILHGSFKIIKDLPELPQKKLEPYFFLLDFEMNSRIRNFPKHLIRTSAEALFEYLNKRYGIKVSYEIPHDVIGIEREFIKLLRLLDKKTYS